MKTFSNRSKSKLKGVHPDLIKVTKLALEYSKHDFGITEGIRTEARQRQLLAQGKSKTMKSRHLTGHAVDVVAYVGGEYTYKPFSLYTDIAEAYRVASLETGIPILWGASWIRQLSLYDSASDALDDYVKTRRAEGRKPFLDGPHFQLTWRQYP